MRIPFLDTWDDDNYTLQHDLGNGYLTTQGADYRYEDKPKSVVFLRQERPNTIPMNQQENPIPAVPGDFLANIRIPEKPDRFRNAPSKQEENLRDAEKELQQAKIDDAQTGSEGYERKPDGVFSRIANWGNSVGDYLFGKDKSTAETQVPLTSDAIRGVSLSAAANQIVDNLNSRDEEQQKEEKGILGYYGDKLLGKQGRQEWNNFKQDWNDRGIGAVTQRANSLLEDMARSPYARFVDPTTVLGGQRTMVNDIDKYFDKRGIGALRDDLLKQDMLNNQTLLGQAERYATKSPEERAIIDQFMQNRRAAGYQGVGPKNSAAAANQDAREMIATGADPDTAYQAAATRWGVTPDEARAAKPLVSTSGSTNPRQWAIIEGRKDYEANPELYPDGVGQAIGERWNQLPEDMRRSSYQAKDRAQETYDVKMTDEYVKEAAAIAKEAGLADIDRPVAKELLDRVRANPSLVGGGFIGKTLKEIAGSLDIESEDQANVRVLLSKLYGSEIAKVINEQNVGSISNDERKEFQRQVASLGDGAQSLEKRVRLYDFMNQLAQDTRAYMLTENHQSLPVKDRWNDLQQHYIDRLPTVQARIKEIMGTSYIGD